MDIALIETLRWERETGFARLDRHLARLARSARALGLAGADRAREALFAAAREGDATPLRVRLELFPDGRIDVQTAPFIPLAPDLTWRVKIATARLASTDPLLRHKTSRRAVYTKARAELSPSEADEVLLLNEHDKVCEGTITSLFLDDGSGLLRTPRLACGLLAGVLREELLDEGKAIEQTIRPEDLARFPFYLGNSLRGLVRGVLVG